MFVQPLYHRENMETRTSFPQRKKFHVLWLLSREEKQKNELNFPQFRTKALVFHSIARISSSHDQSIVPTMLGSLGFGKILQ